MTSIKMAAQAPIYKIRKRSTLVPLAFVAVYLIWGSTYLGIRIAIETIPPFLMVGARFLIAGALMLVWAMARGEALPSRNRWRPIVIIGALMLAGGTGGVTWAEQTVPSGTAALLVAIVPLWMVLLDWLRPGGVRPGRKVILGLALGLLGIVLLVGPGEIVGAGKVNLVGAAVIVLAALSWSLGSIYSRSTQVPASPMISTALQMIAGGFILTLLGSASGEWSRLDLAQISTRSFLSVAYLIIFGSIVAFSAYIWLLRVSTPARVSTYAFVNPVVAVFLGWALAGEILTGQTMIAAAIIVSAVAIITISRSK